MNTRILLLAPLLLVLSSCASAPQTETTPAAAVPSLSASGYAWADVDRDADQKISRKEYRSALQRRFRELDKDGSGKLDANECQPLAAWCKMADTNKDGNVDANEFLSNGMKDFRKADRSQDKMLDRAEQSGLVIFSW